MTRAHLKLYGLVAFAGGLVLDSRAAMFVGAGLVAAGFLAPSGLLSSVGVSGAGGGTGGFGLVPSSSSDGVAPRNAAGTITTGGGCGCGS